MTPRLSRSVRVGDVVYVLARDHHGNGMTPVQDAMNRRAFIWCVGVVSGLDRLHLHVHSAGALFETQDGLRESSGQDDTTSVLRSDIEEIRVLRPTNRPPMKKRVPKKKPTRKRGTKS